jgi:hypothetical protein
MRASVGDRIVIQGHKVGEHGRDAVILAVEGEGGGPPYMVRWDDTGREVLFFPGSDAVVEHYPSRSPTSLRRSSDDSKALTRTKPSPIRGARSRVPEPHLGHPAGTHRAN